MTVDELVANGPAADDLPTWLVYLAGAMGLFVSGLIASLKAKGLWPFGGATATVEVATTGGVRSDSLIVDTSAIKALTAAIEALQLIHAERKVFDKERLRTEERVREDAAETMADVLRVVKDVSLALEDLSRNVGRLREEVGFNTTAIREDTNRHRN